MCIGRFSSSQGWWGWADCHDIVGLMSKSGPIVSQESSKFRRIRGRLKWNQRQRSWGPRIRRTVVDILNKKPLLHVPWASIVTFWPEKTDLAWGLRIRSFLSWSSDGVRCSTHIFVSQGVWFRAPLHACCRVCQNQQQRHRCPFVEVNNEDRLSRAF